MFSIALNLFPFLIPIINPPFQIPNTHNSLKRPKLNFYSLHVFNDFSTRNHKNKRENHLKFYLQTYCSKYNTFSNCQTYEIENKKEKCNNIISSIRTKMSCILRFFKKYHKAAFQY